MNMLNPINSDGLEQPSGATTDGAGSNTSGEYLAPGSPAALTYGCRCSVLANAFYLVGAEESPLVDLGCGLHLLPVPDRVSLQRRTGEPDPDYADHIERGDTGSCPPQAGRTAPSAP
jgi:hypothetical protein